MKNNRMLKILLIACAVMLLGTMGMNRLPFARAEQYSTGDAEISAAVRKLHIDWTSGAVHIAYHSGNTVIISEKITGTVKEDMRMRWRLDGDTLRIEYNKPGFHLFSFLPHDKELTVTLPKGLALESAEIHATSGVLDIPALHADKLKLDVTSGDIRAAVNARIIESELTSGNLELQVMNDAEKIKLSSTSGDITIESAWNAEKTDISTTSGRIRASIRQTGEFKAKSTSGDIHTVIGSVKKAEIGSTSGSVIAEIAGMEALKIHTTSGNVNAYLPAVPGFKAKIETASGRFEHQLPLSKQGKAYIAGDGSGDVEISTTSGNVTLSGIENASSIK